MAGELHQIAHSTPFAKAGQVHAGEITILLILLILQHFLPGPQPLPDNFRLAVQEPDPLVSGAAGKNLFHARPYLFCILNPKPLTQPLAGRQQTLIQAEVQSITKDAKGIPGFLIHHIGKQKSPAVPAGINAVRPADIGVMTAAPPKFSTGHGYMRQLPLLQPEGSAERTGLHSLPAAKPLPRQKSRNRAKGQLHGPGCIHDYGTRQHRLPVCMAGVMQKPAPRRGGTVQHGFLRIRPPRAKAIDRCINQLGIKLCKTRKGKTQLFKCRLPVVGQEHIRLCKQPLECLSACRSRSIQAQRPFAAVGRNKLRAGRLWRRPVVTAPRMAARVAERRLNLDDICAHVSKIKSSSRTLHGYGHLYDCKSLKRPRHGCLLANPECAKIPAMQGVLPDDACKRTAGPAA